MTEPHYCFRDRERWPLTVRTEGVGSASIGQEVFAWKGEDFARWDQQSHVCVDLDHPNYLVPAGGGLLRKESDFHSADMALWQPFLTKGWDDKKHDTTQTGGAERRVCDPWLMLALFGHYSTATGILNSWNSQQQYRPWSWDGRYSKGQDWLDGMGPGSTTPAGYNRVDLAHASRSQSWAGSLLGNPVALMMFWLELRVLMNDTVHEEQAGNSAFDQPRAICWWIVWLTRAVALGAVPRTYHGGELDPWNHLQTFFRLFWPLWSKQYPLDRKLAGQSTDPKVFPQSKKIAGEVAGYYCWQRGLVALALAYCAHHFKGLNLFGVEHWRVLSEVLGTLEFWYSPLFGMPYSYGTSVLTETEVRTIQEEFPEENWESTLVGTGFKLSRNRSWSHAETCMSGLYLWSNLPWPGLLNPKRDPGLLGVNQALRLKVGG